MPRPGQTPTAAYEGLDYGENQAANDVSGIDQGPEPQPFTPQGDEEQFLYAPTDRPAEPLTHGAPFGPGAPVARFAHESNSEFMSRVAQQLGSDPNAAPEVRAFAARVLRGE